MCERKLVGRLAEMIAMGKESAIMNWDNVHASVDFSGQVCSEALNLAWNYPASPEQLYGPWVVSICPASCDTTRAMCFCGEGTNYPNRPVAEACGFKIKSEPGVPILTDWGKPDMDALTTNSSVPGWCNVDPEEGYAGKVKFKEECHCKYDGRTGKFCEIPVYPPASISAVVMAIAVVDFVSVTRAGMELIAVFHQPSHP